MPVTMTGTKTRGATVLQLVGLPRLTPSGSPPALNRAITQHRASVVPARGNSGGVGDAGNRDGYGAVRRLRADRTVSVVSPALNRAITQHRTDVLPARGDHFRDELFGRCRARGLGNAASACWKSRADTPATRSELSQCGIATTCCDAKNQQ